MERGNRVLGRSKRQLAWRVAAVVQGMAICTFAAFALAWAVTIDRSALRSPEAAPPATNQAIVPAALGAGPPNGQAFYIVSSEEEAAVLRDALAEGNDIRHSLGLNFLEETVLVAESASDAELLAERLYEGNRILAAFQLEDRVINLVS